MSLDAKRANDLIATTWQTELIGQLKDYISIPALSPHFDPDWETSGHIRAAVDQYRRGSRAGQCKGCRLKSLKSLVGHH